MLSYHMEQGSEQLHEVRVSRGLSRPCPKVTPCTCSSHSGKKFSPLDGMEWETLVWLPVTPKPSPIVIGTKSLGARGVSEELEESATVKSGSRNMATPFQAGRNLSRHLMSALASVLRLIWWWSFLTTVVDRSIR